MTAENIDITLESNEPETAPAGDTEVVLEKPLTLYVRGSFVLPLLLSAAEDLNIKMEHPPTDQGPDHEIEFINSQENAIYMYFASWGGAAGVEKVVSKLTCPKIFWNLEDPNHFKTFHSQAHHADFIFTSAAELIPTYQQIFKGIPVHSTWWACDPMRHYPDRDDLDLSNREFDIIFVGNRYPREQVRCLGEDTVLVPAIKWAKERGLKIGVFGMGNSSPLSWRGFLDVWLDDAGREPFEDDEGTIKNDSYTGVYQKYTNALDVGVLYRKSKVVICLNEQDDSPTMTSMRTYEAAGCGNVCLSHYSKATETIFGDNVYSSRNPKMTVSILEDIFKENGNISQEALRKSQKCMFFVHEHHTYYHRLRFMLEKITDHLT